MPHGDNEGLTKLELDDWELSTDNTKHLLYNKAAQDEIHIM